MHSDSERHHEPMAAVPRPDSARMDLRSARSQQHQTLPRKPWLIGPDDLSDDNIGAEGAGRLAGELEECKALAHLDGMCAERAGRLAGELRECTALAHLALSWNGIPAKGAGRLAGVLGACTALAHLDLSCTKIDEEGAERIVEEVLRACSQITLGLGSSALWNRSSVVGVYG